MEWKFNGYIKLTMPNFSQFLYWFLSSFNVTYAATNKAWLTDKSNQILLTESKWQDDKSEMDKWEKDNIQFIKSGKYPRNLLSLRNNLSISLRFLYMTRSYIQGVSRLALARRLRYNRASMQATWFDHLHNRGPLADEEVKRENPSANRSLRPSGASCACPWGQGKNYGCSGICGNQMNFGGPTTFGFADGLRAVFFMRECRQGALWCGYYPTKRLRFWCDMICCCCNCSETFWSTPRFAHRFIRV